MTFMIGLDQVFTNVGKVMFDLGDVANLFLNSQNNNQHICAELSTTASVLKIMSIGRAPCVERLKTQ